MLVVTCLLFVCASVARGVASDIIQFPETLYVEPGTTFELKCSSDVSANMAIFTPQEGVPSEAAILDDNAKYTEVVERTTTINEYEDAAESDGGVYTCLVQHGPAADPPYSLATCHVQVKDLCEGVTCLDLETCIADYARGTASCICDIHCSTSAAKFDPLCTDTCELMWNECHLRETICNDKVAREISYKGFCAGTVNPVINVLPGVQNIEEYPMEEVVLNAGVMVDGTPSVQVTWTFYPADGSADHVVEVYRNQHSFVLDAATAGIYEAKVTQCKAEDKAVINTYNVQIIPPPTPDVEVDPLIDIDDQDKVGAVPVCSVYPGGAVEAFSGIAAYYNLACSHVLAADVLTDGTITDPWFIYGTFDQHDGKVAMRAMSFYIGKTVFEIQRGWVLNVEGEKVPLEEGVPQDIPDSPCNIVFTNLHLVLECPRFTVYYDGIMAGHIKMKGSDGEKSLGSFGLCYDAQSGFRKNWQVGESGGDCAVDLEAGACTADEAGLCLGLESAPRFGGGKWGPNCGNGAKVSCTELYCALSSAPSSAQVCALTQAERVNCELKYGEVSGAQDEGCPEEACSWKKEVASRGCPQAKLPFVCEGEEV